MTDFLTPGGAPVTIPGWRCERCGHTWSARAPGRTPVVCPGCKSPYWHRPRRTAAAIATVIAVLLLAAPAYAQSPVYRMVQRLSAEVAAIAAVLSVVAVVVGGLTMAFSNGGFAARIASILFGIALACGAASVVSWFVA